VASLEDLRLSPTLAGDGAGVLRLPRDVLAAMLAHVEAGYPDEACGVLAGEGGRVVRHFAAANAAAEPRTFSEIGPRELLAIWNEIDAHDWQALAYYHSHPASEASPSPRDVRYAQGWPGTYYVIFSLAERARPVVRAFLMAGETTREYRVAVEG
jgi:proteasome lid subunit RPN8/RPN11